MGLFCSYFILLSCRLLGSVFIRLDVTRLEITIFPFYYEAAGIGLPSTVINTMTKNNSGGPGILYLTDLVSASSERNLEVGSAAESREEHCLLARFSWLTQSAFLYNHSLRGGAVHSGLDPPISIINQEEAP